MPDLTMQEVADQIKASNQKTFGEADVRIKKLEDEIQKITNENKAAQDKIEALKDDAASKGALIVDLQNIQKDFNAKNARKAQQAGELVRGFKGTIEDWILDNKDILIKAADTGRIPEMSVKVSNVSTGSLTGTGSPYTPFYLPWQPGMEPLGQTRVRQFVGTVMSDSDTVYFPVANNPSGTGSFANQASEGSAKNQIDRGWSMTTVNLTAFAAYMIVSRQSLRNISFLQTWLPTSMLEQMLDQEDLMFGNALVAAATGSTTGVTVGTTVNAESIVILIKNQIKTKHYPTAVLLDPDAWQKILLTKASPTGTGSIYSLPNVVAVDPAGTVRILGKPLYPVNWLTGGRCLLGDFTKAAIVESESLSFRQTDAHASTFIANQITYLMERTEGIAIYRTEAFTTCLLTASI
jgi:HK97 family phage major capsid protein